MSRSNCQFGNLTAPEVKKCFDNLSISLWNAQQELRHLIPLLKNKGDINVANEMLSDLIWAVENCTVIGLHQIGKALNDSMGET